MSVINTGESVFTRREPRTSHELQEIFRLNRYRSDIERGMLVKLSVPPFLNQNASVQQSIDLQIHADFIHCKEPWLLQKIKVVLVITFIRLKR